MLRINPAQQFALIKSDSDGVIGLASAGLPGWLLARQNHCQLVEIGHDVRVDRLVDCKQSGLVSQKLTQAQ